jgi:hypothetical protein
MHEDKSATLHMDECRDGRTSSESTILSYKVLVSLCLPAIANLAMSSSTKYEHLLDTIKNGKHYSLYKLKTFPARYDTSAITHLISTIEYFFRSELKESIVFSEDTVSHTFFDVDEHVCVQIVGPKKINPEDGCVIIPKERCIYWAEGSNLVTGTVILSKNEVLPYDEAKTYGNFKSEILGTCFWTSLKNHTNNLPFRTSQSKAY